MSSSNAGRRPDSTGTVGDRGVSSGGNSQRNPEYYPEEELKEHTSSSNRNQDGRGTIEEHKFEMQDFSIKNNNNRAGTGVTSNSGNLVAGSYHFKRASAIVAPDMRGISLGGT